jgi:hypothetical protein
MSETKPEPFEPLSDSELRWHEQEMDRLAQEQEWFGTARRGKLLVKEVRAYRAKALVNLDPWKG